LAAYARLRASVVVIASSPVGVVGPKPL